METELKEKLDTASHRKSPGNLYVGFIFEFSQRELDELSMICNAKLHIIR